MGGGEREGMGSERRKKGKEVGKWDLKEKM